MLQKMSEPREITEGKLQLPDFQRGWVWDDEHVRSLLVSVARSFPVGAVMLLDTGGEVRFQVRPIENLTFSGTVPESERLILDGQQRLTSLTQVLALDTPVKTYNEQGKPITRHYQEEVALDIHHIFPKAWCEQQRIKPTVYNAIVNKTPISYKANRMIGSKTPSSYLGAIQSHKQVGLDDASMNAILHSHRIDSVALRADDFEQFYRHRQESLLMIVEQAMGKTIERDAKGVSDEDLDDQMEMEEADA